MRKLSTQGFTLIEIMIALALSGVVMVTMFTAFRSQERSYNSQEEIVDLQQTLRAGLSIMADDLRMAGYDPDGQYNVGFKRAEKDVVEFSMVSDWDGRDNTKDGKVDEDGEKNLIQYSLYNDSDNPGLDNLGRKADGDTNRVKTIEHVSRKKLRFAYTLADGSGPYIEVPGNQLDDIVKVDVYLLVETARQMHQLSSQKSYEIPDGDGKTVTWATTNRHLFVQKTIFCRNMVN
ncbi:MAG: prepilin-type N-terminal cleavage/methylation domain-containing protein [Desulfobulbaceae bacterium]|nr:prepilin-type N-terminal cleavage/methylation domain-containing protein [Desulfobulbaceae bacterium]